MTLVLQRLVSADIKVPMEKGGIPNCSCERVLIFGADRVIWDLGQGLLSWFLSLSCERTTKWLDV